MIRQAETSLAFGSQLIEEDMSRGGFFSSMFVKPAVKFFYNYIAKKNLKKSAMEQLYVTLDAAKEVVERGIAAGTPEFDELVERYFPRYLANDSTVLYCKKGHRNFRKLKELTRKTFFSQIRQVVNLLCVELEADEYDDLIKLAFPTKKQAREALIEQLDFTDQGIAVVESDPSILDIPTGKDLILRILRKGFDRTKAQFLRDLEELYPS